jgi:hypothetical protein
VTKFDSGKIPTTKVRGKGAGTAKKSTQLKTTEARKKQPKSLPTKKKSVSAGGAKVEPAPTANGGEVKPVVVKHSIVVPEGLPKKYFLKSTFNTHDIMHAPVEKTLKMLDKILAGERLFTM